MRKNWAASWRINRLPGFVLLIFLAACAGGEASTPPPTLTLIPAIITDTPSPAPPTATRAALPGPGDVVTAGPADEETPESDPVAAELVQLAQRRLGDILDLPTRRIRVVEVRPVRWPDSSLGCPLPGQTYTAVQIDGYRIVLLAGEREYIFHTDFDHALPCDAANEQLPEAE
ncbi:MAG: hypothetical protein DWB42_03840 [Chloroflexi bacterium]|nr:hypothetical protein [Chloroflexota bacterium]MDL1882110.1 hypothetical protein [Anaerolineae bacterium CFX8]